MVASQSPHLRNLKVNTYPFPCLQGAPSERRVLDELPIGMRDGSNLVMGGSCLLGWDPALSGMANVSVVAPSQCFYLLAPQTLVDHLIAEGAYLMSPGWLANWRNNIAQWGFDQKTARHFFQESTAKLVLLNTGVYEDSLKLLAEMGEHLGLPWSEVPVGLEVLRLTLDRHALEMSRGDKSLNPTPQYFADHLMVLDLMADLLTAAGEREAVERIEALFNLLFAPGRLVYEPADPAKVGATETAAEGEDWTDLERGFTVRLHIRNENLGSLVVDELALVAYKDRYLALALPLAKVCALALSNARVLDVRREAELALRNMANIVRSSEDAIIGENLHGVIASWNHGARRIFGYDEDEVLGRPASFLTPPDLPDVMGRKLEKILTGETTDQVETAWITKDGRVLDVSLQVSPIIDDSGRVVGASCIARDISKEKQKAAQELRSLEAQLLQAQKLESVGRLAGGVAHDFNNMLGVILGYCEMAMVDLDPEDERYQDMEQIQDAAERAKALTRQLLAFARKQVLQPVSLDLNTVIADFGKMIKRLLGEDIDVKLFLDGYLPAIKADPSMMEQIILNLAVNARDAMRDGGRLTIETKVVQLDQSHSTAKFEVTPGEYVMMAVSDTGEGMDETTRQMIFEPFFTTKEPGQGTGLGLSTVYGIVKQHSGGIWVYSELGHGTTFKIYLPVDREGEAAQTLPVESAVYPSGWQTIMVVEDDGSMRKLVCGALENLGYKVLCNSRPSEALETARKYTDRIHLMLTDVVMPEMNGRDLYELVKPLRPEMKVIFTSGYTEEVIAHRGVLDESITFIQKPYSIKLLAQKLESVLNPRDPA